MKVGLKLHILSCGLALEGFAHAWTLPGALGFLLRHYETCHSGQFRVIQIERLVWLLRALAMEEPQTSRTLPKPTENVPWRLTRLPEDLRT